MWARIDPSFNLEAKLSKDLIHCSVGFKQIKATCRLKPLAPKLVIVLCIGETPVHWWMFFIDQYFWWFNQSIWRWTIESWHRDPLAAAVHNCSMEHALVTIVAQYLDMQKKSHNNKHIISNTWLMYQQLVT